MLSALVKIFPVKTVDIEAKLIGVNGFTGRGEIEFAAWSSGRKQLEVELKGVAGRQAEVHARGKLFAAIDLDNGKAGKKFNSVKGDLLPDFAAGERVEIRQNGDLILQGVFQPDD